MTLGHRMGERQASLWIGHGALPRSKGHAFYAKLNPLLREAGFDRARRLNNAKTAFFNGLLGSYRYNRSARGK